MVLMILMILICYNEFNDFNAGPAGVVVAARLLPGGWGYRTPLGGGLDGFLKETQGKPTGRRRVHSPGPASAIYFE